MAKVFGCIFYLMDALATIIISAASCLSFFFGQAVGMDISISSTDCMKNTK
jgi:hypothetical protein